MLQRVPDGQAFTEVHGADHSYLRMTHRPKRVASGRTIRTVDVFAGCGGTALGIEEACRSLGYRSHIAWAIDVEAAACRVFRDNFAEANLVEGDIRSFLASDVGARLTQVEECLRDAVGPVDLLVGGPPCQGHSDLNNFSRRNDAKNGLYLYMARAAKVFRPSHIIIENVQGLPHDRSGVLERTLDVLGEEGYHFSHGLVDIARLGVPQRRRRHIVLASRVGPVRDLHDIVLDAECNERDVAWAIKDLSDSTNGSIVNTPSRPSKDNHARMDYLFDNGLFELPNEQRPPCHRDKKQTYTSVYGRMRWDRPSQTITSGFFSMCMGRYVHPERRRTITAHEAARLQFFPDYFKFESAKSRTALARIIGNAVPMKLSYVLARELLVER